MKDIIRQLLLCILVFPVTISTSRADQYLFLVGVQDYSQGGDLRPLNYAEEDVHKLAAVFSKSGVRDDHIVLMTKRAASTESGARFLPTSELINKELELLLNQLRPEDSIIVGFSGHGLQLKGDSTNYFCPINAELAPDRKDTLISIPKVYRMLSACKANTKLLLVDACRNDPLSSSSKSTRRIEIEPVFSRPAPVVAGGTVAIFSCSATEQSFEDETIKSGIFFHFITLGLSGDADINGDGIVDVNDLETFTTDRVRNWARDKLSKSQTPERQGESRGRIELIRMVGDAKQPKKGMKGSLLELGVDQEEIELSPQYREIITKIPKEFRSYLIEHPVWFTADAAAEIIYNPEKDHWIVMSVASAKQNVSNPKIACKLKALNAFAELKKESMTLETVTKMSESGASQQIETRLKAMASALPLIGEWKSDNGDSIWLLYGAVVKKP
jgi:uncharacterized caspase-like protein